VTPIAPRLGAIWHMHARTCHSQPIYQIWSV